ncbi:coiled-coil domain-containing protein 158-like isoform X5 [Sander lucioperca]|uniref:coiled-coil domain-containing protein 158-like isoform X5 n=1 Tax=Sander lucioperca TaxID=283035 RepID=UPI00165353D8|nr:coiled-coil domain-containing protein 158-like isoform X5 [Sander lucioperca]
MSSEFQPSDRQTIPLFSNNGAHAQLPPKYNVTKLTQAGTTDIYDDASSRLRFNSLTLDELSEELNRRTKETQRLQEEVENATKLTLERFACTYGINSSPGQSCHNHRRFDVYDSPGNTILTTDQQAVTQPLVLNQGDISSPGKKVFENAVEDCLQQLSDLQLHKTHDQPEQEPFSFDKAIVNLQTKLHKVQKEKDDLSNLRLKDSRVHVGQMEKMLCMLEALQNIQRAEDQKLQETEEETLALNRKIETLEQNVKEMYSLKSHETQCGHNAITSPDVATSSRQLSPAAKKTEDFNDETDEVQERLFLSKHLGSEECSGVNKQKERMEDLIASLGQEMALLTAKLSSSKNNSVSLSVKLELLKKLAERQTSLHQCQVCCLEQQLIEAQSQLVDAQRERERSLQQAEELRSQLGQLKRCGEQQQGDLQEEVKALRGQLEAAREEKSCLQEGRKSQELLEEKNKELQFRQQEAQHHLARLEEAQSRCQALHAEVETLRQSLGDREKMIESSIHMTAQHRSTIDELHQENSLLSNQLNQHKLEIQQLRAELDRRNSDLAAAEHERRQLQASVAEQSQRVQEESLEKRQLTIQLEVQCMQLLTLTKKHKELQQLHSCKNEEHEGVVLKLQSQLRNAHDELDQVGSTLRTLEGADGHGLQVAVDMQEEITARREQVDSLQGKIQHLEDILDKLYQEKRYQSLENQRQLGELTFVREEKRQLGNELEALRSKDKQLGERISQLEAILHKMSESFADCQDFIQLQEQDFFRLKLQHALDLKELQGQNLRTALNVPPPDLDSPSPSALTAPPFSQHASNTQITQESPAWELRSLVKELREVISENRGPHTDNRRRSAPERVHSTMLSTDKAEKVKAGSRLRRKTCSSEPRFLKAAELNGKTINSKSFNESRVISSPATAAWYTSSPQLLSLGRRSPVHSLLTSDPNS